jgi:hypothetical protein
VTSALRPSLRAAGLTLLMSAAAANARAAGGAPARMLEDPAPMGLTLPDGPVARAWALVGPETEPAELPEAWVEALAPGCWEGSPAAKTWARWAAAVERAAGPALAERAPARAELALLAAADGQPQVAWGHAAAVADAPAWTATLVPRLLPGIPLDHPVGPGGDLGTLAAGVRLRPLPPPLDPALPAWALGAGVATFGGLRIGQAEVDLMVEVQPAGVEVAVGHRGGGPAELVVALPLVRGASVRTEYLDFVRQEDLHGARALVVRAEDEEPRVLYGRLAQEEGDLPAPPRPGAALPRALSEAGLRLVPADGAPDAGPAARALGQLLSIEATVGPAEDAGRATVVRVPAGPEGRAVLRALRAAVEERLLASR